MFEVSARQIIPAAILVLISFAAAAQTGRTHQECAHLTPSKYDDCRGFVRSSDVMASPADTVTDDSCTQSRRDLQQLQPRARTLESDRKYAVNRRERCESFKVALSQNPAANIRAGALNACNEAQTAQARVDDTETKLKRFAEEVKRCDAADAVAEERTRPERERAEREAQARVASERAAETAAESARQQEAERAFRATLNRSSAQSLYLLGGKFEREGNSSRATEAYEYLIEKHTESPWAVRANDRLLQMKASNETEEARRRASRQSACIAGVPLCQDRCSISAGYSALQRCREACVSQCN